MITALVIALATCLVVGISMGFNAVGNIFFTCLYAIARWFLIVIDFMQSLVRKLCGLDDKNGDVLFDTFIRSEEVKIALLAILALSIILVFGFALVQIIRLQYTTEGGKNAVGPLVKTCLKSIFLFCLIPFTSFLGVYVSNQLLKAVDAATSTSGSTSIAGRIFKIAAKDANPYRSGEVEWVFVGWDHVFDVIVADVMPGGDTYDRDTGIYKKKSGYTNAGERKIYIENGQISGSDYVGLSSVSAEQLDNIFAQGMDSATKVKKSNKDKAVTLKNGDLLNFSDFDSVYFFYNIGKINYFVLFLCGWYLFKTLITILFGLVMRIYKVSILFIISPYPVALTVLDNGSALNKWKGKYLAELFSAYGSIAGLNLFLTLIPIIDKIKLYYGSAWYISLFNDFVQIIFLLVGCLMIKDIVGIISEFVGGGNVLSQGEGMQKQVGDIAKKAGSAAVGVAMGGIALAKGAAGTIGAAINTHNANKAAGEMASEQEKIDAANKEVDDLVNSDENLKTYESDKSELASSQDRLASYNTQIEEMKNKAGGKPLKGKAKKRYNQLIADRDAEQDNVNALQSKIEGVEKSDNFKKYQDLKAKAARVSEESGKIIEEKKKAISGYTDENDVYHEGYQDKFFKHQTGALQGRQMMLNMIGSNKIVQGVNKATNGLLTSKGRKDLTKQVSEMSDDAAVVVTGNTKRAQNVALSKTSSFKGHGIPKVKDGKIVRDENGNPVMVGASKNISRNPFRSGVAGLTQGGLSSRVAKFSNFETMQEQGKQVGAAIDEKSLNDLANTIKDVFTNAQKGTLSDVAIDNLIANKSDFVESAGVFGGADAEKAMSAMINALEKSKNTTDSKQKAELVNEAKNSAQKVKVESFAKIDQDSIRQMKEAIKSATLQKSVANKDYGAALDKVVYKAMVKAQEHTQNVKNDPKTENIIPQLLRELLNETRKKK